MAVKDKQPVADNMFEPLKETIELLKTYGQELPDEVHQQLQVQMKVIIFIAFYMYALFSVWNVLCMYHTANNFCQTKISPTLALNISQNKFSRSL